MLPNPQLSLLRNCLKILRTFETIRRTEYSIWHNLFKSFKAGTIINSIY